MASQLVGLSASAPGGMFRMKNAPRLPLDVLQAAGITI